jgi:ABC-type polysaccharide/polyol phosphate transport system ATPase subunit
VAVIGPNGAGSLLGMVAEVMSAGRRQDKGEPCAAARRGFSSGDDRRRECAEERRLAGLSAQQTEAAFDSIVEFSGIGQFVQEPLRTYSYAKAMRLAFSIAVHAEPEILIIDELAVGDAVFQTKCMGSSWNFS